MRRLMSALSVTALVALPLGLITPSALADPARTATIPCSDAFGPDSQGMITVKQNDNKITLSLHCTNTGAGTPDHAAHFKCRDVFGPDVKGQFVLTPSGNVEGHCSFPL